MNKNYSVIAIIGIVVIVGVFYFSSSRPSLQMPSQNQGNTSTTGNTETGGSVPAPVQSKSTGRVVFSVSDEAVGLDTLQSVLLTINEVSVQSPQSGWVSVSKTPRTFDLLALKNSGRNELLSDVNLSAGTYNQIRLSIGKVVVVQKNGLKNVEAKVPSQTLRFNAKLVVEKGKASGASFDFNAGKALHSTGEGTLVFFPVFTVDTVHGVGKVQILAGNVELLNGLPDFDQTLGVDENGNLKVGYSINAVTKIEFMGKVIHLIPMGEKPEDIKVSAQAAITTAINGGYITSATSVQTTLRENKRVWQVVGAKGGTDVTVYIDIATGAVLAVQ